MSVVRVPAAARPRWVVDAIANLHLFEGDIDKRREQLAEVALWLKGQGVDTSGVADAAHDLEHAEQHIASTRRALLMAWPDEGGA